MTDDPTGSCVVCQRRPPNSPPVCDLCRRRLAARLWELRDLHALLPAALAPGQNGSTRVSGSREAPLPLRVDALDLAAPANRGQSADTFVPAVTVGVEFEPSTSVFDSQLVTQRVKTRHLLWDEDGGLVMRPAGDQTGRTSVATILDSWAREWAEVQEVSPPAATVDSLVSWLSRQLPWALDHHPAIDEFAAEITTTLYALRALLNVSRAPIYLVDPCRSCGVAALKREPEAEEWECANCWATTPLTRHEEAQTTAPCG